MTLESLSAFLSACAAGILAFLTYRNVKQTGIMASEMKDARNPDVYVDVEFYNPGEITLTIGNSGKSPAKSIKFFTDDSLVWRKELNPEGFKQIPAIKNGISYLAPDRVYKYQLYFQDRDNIFEKGSFIKFS